MPDGRGQENQYNESSDNINRSIKARFDLNYAITEQKALLGEVASKLQVSEEDQADQVKKIANLTERTDRQPLNSGFLIEILSHPATSTVTLILGVALCLVGIACLGASAGVSLFGITLTVVGTVVAGASIASKFGLFSNGSGAKEIFPSSNTIHPEMTPNT